MADQKHKELKSSIEHYQSVNYTDYENLREFNQLKNERKKLSEKVYDIGKILTHF